MFGSPLRTDSNRRGRRVSSVPTSKIVPQSTLSPSKRIGNRCILISKLPADERKSLLTVANVLSARTALYFTSRALVSHEGENSYALPKLNRCDRVGCTVGVDRQRPSLRFLEISQPQGTVEPFCRPRAWRSGF